jgi:hypothetical protein
MAIRAVISCASWAFIPKAVTMVSHGAKRSNRVPADFGDPIGDTDKLKGSMRGAEEMISLFIWSRQIVANIH